MGEFRVNVDKQKDTSDIEKDREGHQIDIELIITCNLIEYILYVKLP